MRKTFLSLAVPVAAAMFIVGCSSNPEPKTEAKKDTLHDNAVAALNRMQREDPGLRNLLDRSAGYAIFPDVGKGAAVAGGAYGRGEVYQNGQMVGYADLKQATIGLQAGGQVYGELIVFENQSALDKFKQGNYTFAGNASAVALKAGASTGTAFKNGVAVFTLPEGGLMFEAAIGGQKFDFSPASGDYRSDVASDRMTPRDRSYNDRPTGDRTYERTETTTEHRDHGTGVRGEVDVNPNR